MQCACGLYPEHDPADHADLGLLLDGDTPVELDASATCLSWDCDRPAEIKFRCRPHYEWLMSGDTGGNQ